MTTPKGELLDFWLSIDDRGDGSHEVEVRSPAGDGRTIVRLDNVIDDAEAVAATLNSDWRGRKRSPDAPPQSEERVDFEQRLKKTGERLFKAVMVESVGERYRSSYDKAIDPRTGAGLRLRLRIQDPELAALPWEYLYDTTHDHFIARTSLTSVVRYVEVDRKAEPLQASFPISVLGVISSPSDQAPLAKDVERDLIERALADQVASGRLQLTWSPAGTFSAFAQSLRRHHPHVVHFIGHGAFDAAQDTGVVLFEAEDGTSNAVDASTLGAQLLGHRSIRLMVLNSCEGARSAGKNLFSSTAGTLVRRGVPAVVAMQYAITDDAALVFARELYRGLSDFDPLDRAVSNARLQMHAADQGSPEWGTPVLFLQSDTGTLFDLAEVEQPAISSGSPRPASFTPSGFVPPGSPAGAIPTTVTPGATTPVGTTPQDEEVVPAWRRVLKSVRDVVKPVRAIVVSSAAALVFLVNGYFKARDEQAKATAALDLTFESIRKDTTAAARLAAYNGLSGRQLPAQLELYAVRKIVDMIRVEQAATACPATTSPRARTLSAAFDAIRNFQRQAGRKRQFSERAMSALINALAENPARPLTRVVLDRVDLRGVDLSHLQLDSASFNGSCLFGTRFDSSALHFTSFVGAQLDSASFLHASARQANLNTAYLRSTDFSGADLTGADLFGARAACAVFIEARLDSARFEHAEAPWGSFEDASLAGVARWNELRTIENAKFSTSAGAPPDSVVVSALSRGAAPLDVDRRQWIDGRYRAMRRNGVCAFTEVGR